MASLGETGVLDVKHDLKVLWKITDFFSLSTKVEDGYDSPTFSFADEMWYLRICPGGESKESSGYISLFLWKKPTSTKCRVRYTLDVKKADGSLLKNDEEDSHTFEELGRGYFEFIQRSELLGSRSELVPSDVLTIVCTLQKDDPLEGVTPATSMKLSELEKLSKNFEGLLSHTKSCDVTLVVRGESFRVHKAVLVARSSVFSAMFEHEMSESETGTVDIPDCDQKSFGIFLEYLYSGKAGDVSFESALHLYQTAHKYDVEELKTFCLQSLKKCLTVEGVLDAVILADQYDEAELMTSAQDFFNSNFDEILSTKQWKTLNNQNFRLANKLCKGISRYFSMLKQQVTNQASK